MDGTKGGRYANAQALAQAVADEWGPGTQHRFVVLTGGEPCLQVDRALCDALHEHGFTIAIEANGTLDVAQGIDWICVSPKAGAPLRVTSGHELKFVFPQIGAKPEDFEKLNFENFCLQPMDGIDLARNVVLTVEYCLRHPRWRMSTQTHKAIGIR